MIHPFAGTRARRCGCARGAGTRLPLHILVHALPEALRRARAVSHTDLRAADPSQPVREWTLRKHSTTREHTGAPAARAHAPPRAAHRATSDGAGTTRTRRRDTAGQKASGVSRPRRQARLYACGSGWAEGGGAGRGGAGRAHLAAQLGLRQEIRRSQQVPGGWGRGGGARNRCASAGRSRAQRTCTRVAPSSRPQCRDPRATPAVAPPRNVSVHAREART